MIKNNNIKIIGVFATVLLLVIVITSSFAYFGSFNVNLNNNVAVNINAVSPGDATFISSATQLNLQVPAANMSQTVADNETPAASNTATLTVNLTGAANLLTTCTYDIVYEYDSNSNIYGGTGTNHITKNGDKEITLQITNVDGTNNFATEKNFDYDSNWSNNKRTLVSRATISSNGTLTTQNINITGKYYNLTISQSSLEGKAFTGKIFVTNHKCETSEPAYITLLNAYGGKDSITELPDSAFANATTANDKGMYAKADDYTATTGMKSYYYRGAVNNNWVQFGKEGDKDIYWRIIRINGDGSIRMIYTGTTDPQNDSSVTGSNGVYMTGTGTQINATTYKFNSSSNKAEYVGYQYIEGQQHGYGECNGSSASCAVNGSTVYNSVIKQTIDKWYAGTTLKDNDLVADQIFCNDRSASTSDVAYSNTNYTTLTSWNSTGTQYYYGAYGRLIKSKSPVLTCPMASDKFTVNTSNGNGALTYPVGLITADEVAMAGGVYDSSNHSYYLYTNQYYWSGSPNYFNSSGNAIEFRVISSGDIYWNFVNANTDARPVVSLSSKAKLSGNGTYSNPYTVS